MSLWLWLSVAGYAAVAFVVWYLLFGLTNFLNGGSKTFQSFATELMWFIPGGLTRRTNFIKQRVEATLQYPNTNGAFCGNTRSWDFKEVRDNNLYRECAKDVLNSPLEFWCSYVVIPLTWIVSIPVVIVVILVANLLYKEKKPE